MEIFDWTKQCLYLHISPPIITFKQLLDTYPTTFSLGIPVEHKHQTWVISVSLDDDGFIQLEDGTLYVLQQNKQLQSSTCVLNIYNTAFFRITQPVMCIRQYGQKYYCMDVTGAIMMYTPDGGIHELVVDVSTYLPGTTPKKVVNWACPRGVLFVILDSDGNLYECQVNNHGLEYFRLTKIKNDHSPIVALKKGYLNGHTFKHAFGIHLVHIENDLFVHRRLGMGTNIEIDPNFVQNVQVEMVYRPSTKSARKFFTKS